MRNSPSNTPTREPKAKRRYLITCKTHAGEERGRQTEQEEELSRGRQHKHQTSAETDSGSSAVAAGCSFCGA